MPTQIYHITHIDNLPLILETGALLANSRLQQRQVNFRDISYRNIQDRRARKQVPCGNGGYLHEYVPFYFAPRSPMLYTINRGNVPGCPEGQTRIVHLVTTAEAIAADTANFVFTDGHAVIDYSEFYEDLAQLGEAIDWRVMRSTYWNDTDEYPDRKRRRQAEFLVYFAVLWQLITEIGVLNDGIKAEVQEILRKFNKSTPVNAYPNWYY
ncbi:type II toxin-antitoxin system toxin DNA ADP-ribosyl transferase DarT [Leptolyngbya iicbica]|uniref:DUF4433 domain-containing protein n=2 Tax=Cyanophyceae TaxID=3028117 RepID=A0A4Q7EAD0_9CYAN|nr:DUF4433 domain-containing protein [Leptolyngbya sp. LK]RZM79541.1 DUF4433 domain-containing protein [Leptolyngbya sp. LK]